MSLYNCHIHTSHSHDGKGTPDEMCQAAIAAGLSGVAFTDHCDIEYYHTWPEKQKITASVAAAAAMRERYEGKLKVFTGIEIGEAIWDMDAADEIRSLFDYDIVLGSVHAVRGWELPFARIKAGDIDSHTYLTRYFEDVLKTVETCNFDVLSHLTCPLRYIVGKFGETVDLDRYAEMIDRILDAVIQKGCSLEVNTSCIGTAYDALMPDAAILKRYYEKGGRYITLGSDAHETRSIANGLASARETLLSIGFEKAYYYEKRKLVSYTL